MYGSQRGLSPADIFFSFPLRDVSYHIQAAPGVRAVQGIGAPSSALCCVEVAVEAEFGQDGSALSIWVHTHLPTCTLPTVSSYFNTIIHKPGAGTGTCPQVFPYTCVKVFLTAYKHFLKSK